MDYVCSPGGLCIPIWHGDVGGNLRRALLAYATAVSYSELAKLYPGAGSSYSLC